ncbi:Tad domain-containing protein [Sinisalibacter aestuarii]|uniref:Putative Flp pilus-assembly TadG-like N-terminal domain-containing protein n=1 Tax=Sinisalibacter aestuarii TaxID=2949426 RepID=A0ABQ5LWE4_9RHOB|nr:Tad domain-containing protein [Sinisalibacter aestuarii]GKY88705.1 hypothetical protein STA1M1_25740 [Sinisalibacter aestuarii]
MVGHCTTEQDQCDGQKAKRREGFLRSEDGSLIIFALMIFMLMLAAGGLGVDFMRYEAHRARLQATLDRAILAAASLDQPLDPDEVVLDYFEKAGLGQYITEDDIHFTDSANARYVEVNVSMPVKSTFLNFVGISELQAPAVGAAQQMAVDTEISLVLDASTSMDSYSYSGGDDKIEILKDAARQFVNIMTCDPADPDKTTECTVLPGTISISIVPYAEQVVAGEDILSRLPVTAEHTNSSCVTFDDEDFNSAVIGETTEFNRTGDFDARSGRDNAPTDSRKTCKSASWREITPLEGDGEILRGNIQALRSIRSGTDYTSIDVAMKWGTIMLDPAIQPMLSDIVDEDFTNRPLPWTSRSKVIVLMTDGANTTQYYLHDGYRSGPSGVWRTNDKVSSGSYWGGSDYVYSIYNPSRDEYYIKHPYDDAIDGEYLDHPYGTGTYQACSQSWNGWRWVTTCNDVTEPGNGAMQYTFPQLWEVKTWAWYEQFSFLGDPGTSIGTSGKNDRLLDICDAAKARNIQVFTVGFETSYGDRAVLRDCATSDGHYFDVNGLDLTDAFASIAREISKLRLVN